MLDTGYHIWRTMGWPLLCAARLGQEEHDVWRIVLLWQNLGKGATVSKPLNPASSALSIEHEALLVASDACTLLNTGKKVPALLARLWQAVGNIRPCQKACPQVARVAPGGYIIPIRPRVLLSFDRREIGVPPCPLQRPPQVRLLCARCQVSVVAFTMHFGREL